MNSKNELEQAVIALIEKTTVSLDSTVDFLSAELPIYIEQLMMWYVVKGFVAMFISILVLIIGWYISRVYAPALNENYSSLSFIERSYHDINASYHIAIWVGYALVLSGVTFFVSSMWEPLQILVAPNVWLVEYASGMVR